MNEALRLATVGGMRIDVNGSVLVILTLLLLGVGFGLLAATAAAASDVARAIEIAEVTARS